MPQVDTNELKKVWDETPEKNWDAFMDNLKEKGEDLGEDVMNTFSSAIDAVRARMKEFPKSVDDLIKNVRQEIDNMKKENRPNMQMG